MQETWIPDWPERSPMFEPLRRFGAALRGEHWPRLETLQQLIDEVPVNTAGGTRLKLVAQGPRPHRWEERYEARVHLKGELQVREANWHDLFNVLVWAGFPQSKAALNARHYRAMEAQGAAGARNRGPLQDALTLFDEGGVIVAASDPELLSMVENFAWKELFWRNRTRIGTDMCFLVFGHALYEKALEPYTGITARGMLFEVEPDFCALAVDDRAVRLDALLAARLNDAPRLRSTRELAPVPVLGVPGWCAGNASESYYDNAAYFRSARTRARRHQSPL